MPLLTRGGGEWKDTNVGPDNVYIIKFYPGQMKTIYGVYDYKIHHYKLKFTEPDDIYVDGQLACCVEKVIIRRKKDEVPTSIEDGEEAGIIYKREFFRHTNEYWVDETLVPEIGDAYYYKAFPVSTMGFINESTMNEVYGLVAKEHELYGFDMHLDESNPAKMITYPEDCDNAFFTTNNSMSTILSSDWKDVWFLREIFPCMLRSNGTVYRKLQKWNFSYWDNGEKSLYNDIASDLDVMVAFPLVYTKYWYDENENVFHARFSDRPIDEEFHAYAHTNDFGEILPYIYIAAYGSGFDSTRNKFRSINGSKTISVHLNTIHKGSYSYSVKDPNNDSWGTLEYSDWLLLQMIGILLSGKPEVATLSAYLGYNSDGYSNYSLTPAYYKSEPGFFGSKGSTGNTNISYLGYTTSSFGLRDIFGVVPIGGCYIRGLYFLNKKVYVKMTRDNSDGSTGNFHDYVSSGILQTSDYIEIPNVEIPTLGTAISYVSKVAATPYGLFPIECSGSDSTYFRTVEENPKDVFNNPTNAKMLIGGAFKDSVPSSTESAVKKPYSYPNFLSYKNITADVVTSRSINSKLIRLNCKPKLETFKYDEQGNIIENWNDPAYAEANE